MSKYGVKKRKRIQTKLMVYVMVCVIPLTLLLGFALFRMVDYYQKYDRLVRNITNANAYNMSFKESMDETMYRIITGSANWTDPEEKLMSDDPKALIRSAVEHFESLRENTSEANVEADLDQLIKLLGILDERVDDILKNVEEGGHYDENMELLDFNIRTLTSLIQEDIQVYIRDEAKNMEMLRREVAASLLTTTRILVILLVITVIAIIILSRKLSKSITEPITELVDMTEKFAGGDFSVEYHIESHDEMEVLANSFNSMVKEIETLINDIHKEQENARDAELRLLQEQINPHFLYNTLDAILWMTEAGENQDAIKMIQELSNFFRISLSKGKSEISVKSEMEHVRSYLEIQHYRYRDIMDYEILFDENILDCRIQKLTLQPIVENALYHGVKNKRGSGHIKVMGRAEGSDLIFTVEDDGIGMKEDELENLRSLISGDTKPPEEGGFGMANVEQRLEMHYGREYGMRVESEYMKGTTVTVKIPQINGASCAVRLQDR